MTQTMYHGSSSATLALHEGLCLTGDEDAAADYARAACAAHYVHTVEIDWDGLADAEPEGEWDRDEARAASDYSHDYSADVIIYDDESPFNRRHRTYRLLTPAALAAVTVTETRDADDV